MDAKTLKQKLKDQELVAGTNIFLPDPAMVEMMASVGYDFLWIDTEHTALSYQGVLTSLIAARAGGTPAIVRIPWNDAVMAKRVLEMGPEGMIFPMIQTEAECTRAMESTLYPPLGTRGFGPQRAVGYGLKDVVEYVKKDSQDLIRFVQIESIEAVENELDAILDNPWIDCVMLGPADLSASIGKLPDLACKESVAIQDKALQKIRKAGKSAGTCIGGYDEKWIQGWYDRGANVISCGFESEHILTGAKRTLSIIRGAE